MYFAWSEFLAIEIQTAFSFWKKPVPVIDQTTSNAFGLGKLVCSSEVGFPVIIDEEGKKKKKEKTS